MLSSIRKCQKQPQTGSKWSGLGVLGTPRWGFAHTIGFYVLVRVGIRLQL